MSKNKGGRPTKEEASTILKRDYLIKILHGMGHGIGWLSMFFNLSKGRVSQIVNGHLKIKGRRKN